MRKYISKAVITVLISGLLLIGCGSIGVGKTGGQVAEQTIWPETTDAEPLTIGYTFWDVPVDGFCEDQANQIKLVAEALNVNLLFNPDNTNFVGGSEVGAAKYFAEQGVDGMVVVNFGEDYLMQINDICTEAQIPFIQATRTISDPEVAAVVESNPLYVGRMHESDYTAAYELGRKLIDSGAKNILLIGAEHGDLAYESRARGFRDACEEPDVDIIEERWELLDNEDSIVATKELLQKHPEADGIFAIRCGLVPYIVSAQDELGYEKYLPSVGVDFDKTLASYMESGAIVAAAGGHHPDASLSLIILVNSIRGAYDKSLYPIDINYNMFLFDSQESFEEYKEWCLGYDEDFYNKQILNANDARGLCVDFNPDTTLLDMTTFAQNMSLESVKERHSSFIK